MSYRVGQCANLTASSELCGLPACVWSMLYSKAERGSTRIHGPMSTKYEGISFFMTRTAVQLVQQREYEVMKIAVLKAYSFISRFSHPILPRSIHCPQIQHEIHLKILQISLKIWWLITWHYCYSQIRRSLNTTQKF